MIGRPAVISSGTRGMKKRQEKYLMDEENRNSSEHVDLPPIDCIYIYIYIFVSM